MSAQREMATVLPSGWRWARLGEICTLNPRRPAIARAPDAPTTFVQMSAVAEDGKGIIASESRPFHEVQKGYTYFGEGDVLFAKITPCMQNGKSAVARALIDGFGFGSTEFHVLHPCDTVLAEWIHAFLVQPWVLTEAAKHFTGAVGQQRVPTSFLASLNIPLPPLDEQRYIADTLTVQMAAVDRARAASEAQRDALDDFVQSCLRQSLTESAPERISLADALTEVSRGVGASWNTHTLLGATRAGIAPAKEGVGKSPERYKRVDAATIFYNPMRILLGSIAMVDKGKEGGITSPDYVVFKTKAGMLHHRWFYYWLRSSYGEHLIKTLSRGAVRERILFRRLVTASIEVPPWEDQVRCSERLRAVIPLRAKIIEQQHAIEQLPESLLRDAFSGTLSARRPPLPTPETLDGKQERMAAIIAILLEECRQRGRVLGRTVASKGLYLAAAHAGVPLGVPFRRWQYGPYYSGIREVETYAAERGWFGNRSRQWGIEYIPGDAFADALTFAPGFLHGGAGAMHEVTALLAGLDADSAEAVGTLYAAWNDFLLDGMQADDMAIIREVRENWHAEKAKIPVAAWEHWLAWMHAHDLTPRGTGPRTVPAMEGQHG